MVRDETQAAQPDGQADQAAKVAVRFLLEWIERHGLDYAAFGPKAGGFFLSVAAEGPKAEALRGLNDALEAIEQAGFDSVDFLRGFAASLKAVAAGGPVPALAVKRKAP